MPDWDAKYATAEGGPFGGAPNEYLREIVARSDFAARSALCLADGDGRNSAWLAARGMAVTALDLSKVAVERARARDEAAGVCVERFVADLAEWAPSAERRWEAAFLIYLQCEAETRLRAVRIAGAALAPGGWFVLEAFAKGDRRRTGIGPDNPELRYDIGEIERALPGFETVEALAGRVLLNEGARHRGAAQVVRYAARKPA